VTGAVFGIGDFSISLAMTVHIENIHSFICSIALTKWLISRGGVVLILWLGLGFYHHL
jgi:hypothetical protein